MPFVVNMAAAARRHLEAGTKLADSKRADVAAYLFGIAAECAVKAMMQDLRVPSTATRTEDPYFAHFPELRTILRDRTMGRRGAILNAFIQNDKFMANWSIKMRYSDGKQIQEAWIANWAQQAKSIVAAMGT